MKIRNSFVSNSSSSSYVIYGVEMHLNEAIAAVLKEGKLRELLSIQRVALGKSYYEYSPEELLDAIPEEALAKLGFIADDEDYVYWGYHPFNSMKDDETKAEFMERVDKEAVELFGPGTECELHDFTVYS
jgi:uncharacterized protein (UPF0276 family)